jgi:Fur family ferric uptake transcriptional regulator
MSSMHSSGCGCRNHGTCGARHERKLPDVAERLRRKSHKITGPRQAILELLRKRHHPLSTKQIHASLAEGDSDLATVYRSVHLLETMGLVKRFDFGDGIARYELLGEDDDGHHHHLVCTECREVVELEDCFTHELEERIASRSGFKQVTHKLEFFGVCPACQQRAV